MKTECTPEQKKEALKWFSKEIGLIDYWIGVSDCVCHDKLPNGGCLKCDMQKIKNMVESTTKLLNDIENKDNEQIPRSDYCDCTDSVIRRVDTNHPHHVITSDGWYCMGCLTEFVMKSTT